MQVSVYMCIFLAISQESSTQVVFLLRTKRLFYFQYQNVKYLCRKRDCRVVVDYVTSAFSISTLLLEKSES